MGQEISQPSMSAGEVTPAMYARVDLARYFTGLRTCRNWIVKPTGGVENRPGFRYLAPTVDKTKMSRLIDFRFSSAQSYALEFGDYYMRVIYQGALVESAPGVPLSIETPYPEASLRGVTYTQNADVMTLTHQGHPTQQLGRHDHDDWRITEFDNVSGPFGDMNIDLTKSVVASDVTGDIQITSAVDIFDAGMVGQLMRIEQNPEALVAQWEVAAAMGLNQTRKTDTGYYKAVGAGTTGTVRPDHVEGIGYDGDPGIAWEYLHNGSGIVLITVFNSATSVDATVKERLPDSVVTATFPRDIQGVTPGVPGVDGAPGVDVSVRIDAHGYASGESVTIAGVTGIPGANGTWSIVVTDANNFTLPGNESTGVWGGDGVCSKTLTAQAAYKWSLEMWGGDQGYPAASTYYQQRQVFGGAPGRPQAVQMSKSAGYTDFGTTIPGLDDDALNFSLAAGTIGHILHFINLKQLIALTTEGPWMIIKEQGNPIPLTDPQGEGGAATVRPLKINKQALYVEDKGGAIRSLGYEFSSDSYEGKDLTVVADHLFRNKSILEWCYQKIPNRCVWMVRDDGVLIGLTYMIEQEVVGWHRHDTDGFVESVCCVSEPTEDVVYAVVRRSINGTDERYIERIADRKLATPEDAFFVDSGLTYDGRDAGAEVSWILTGGTAWDYTETLTFTAQEDIFVGASDVGDALILRGSIVVDGVTTVETVRLNIIGFTSTKVVTVLASKTVPEQFRDTQQEGYDFARDTFSGLDHLEGKTVAILADARVGIPVIVTAGVATIPNAAAVVHIGLPIVADIETLEVNTQGATTQDRLKNINSLSMMVTETRGLLAGPDEDNLLETRSEIGTKVEELYAAVTGILAINIISDWSKGGRVMIRQDKPLPASIIAIIPTVTASGS